MLCNLADRFIKDKCRSFMNSPTKTYELKIAFPKTSSEELLKTKEEVKRWLVKKGWSEFVEGVVDDLDIDNEYGIDFDVDQAFKNFGGEASPLSIFKYSRDSIALLKKELESSFSDRIICELIEFDTKSWQEGWKESFKPFSTERLYIYPPWINKLNNEFPSDKIPIVIEPGMAFGTGQHATTKLCLSAIERLIPHMKENLKTHTLIDVGCGTGILGIAAKKLGFGEVYATDIDPDAINATKNNMSANQVVLKTEQTTTPLASSSAKFDVVVANILTVVLEKIIPDLATTTKPSGGHVLMSGLLIEHEENLINLSQRCGLVLREKKTLDGWSCLHFVRS